MTWFTTKYIGVPTRNQLRTMVREFDLTLDLLEDEKNPLTG